MKRLRSQKLNSKGSTLVFVIVAIIFIGLLASLILALSASSFKMRTVDYSSRQNFYEGEEYSGKIYSNLGMNAIGILGEAYVNTMGKINTDTIYGQQQLNDYLKKVFYKNMVVYLGMASNTASDADIETVTKAYDTAEVIALTEKLQNIADSSKKLVNVKICGDVVCKINGGTRTTATGEETYPTIVINDVRLQYLDTTTTGNGFESDYTFDIVIQYPEWDFTFVNPASAASDVDTFLDYVLISNGKLQFADGAARTVSGCVATGSNSYVTDNDSTDNGLWITGSTVTFRENTANRYNKLAVVVSDNVRIDSTQMNTSSMILEGNSGDNLWCNSVILGDAKSTTLYTKESGFKSSNANLYIRDDLQLDADYSNASITGGSYFGYGNNNLIEGNNTQNASSAIIVNGKYASLRMENLRQINVLGLAYINLGGTIYRTGESITIKGNQDIYLIPESLMGANVSNPIKAGSSSEGRFNADTLTNNLLSNEWLSGYLDSSSPFITKSAVINGVSYTFYYFRFSTVDAQNRFAADVMSASGNGNVVRTEIRERVLDNLAVMNDRVINKTSQSLEDRVIISAGVSADGGFFTVGADVTSAVTGDQDKAKGTESMSAGNLAAITLDTYTFQRKYTLMKCLLMPVNNSILSNYSSVDRIDLDWKHNKWPTEYTYTGNESIPNGSLNVSAVSNFIDTARLNNYVNMAKSAGNSYYSCKHDGRELRYYNDDVVVDSSFGNVSVVVVDGNVTVTAAFKGLIMATGQITVTGTGELQSDPEVVDELMRAEQNQGSGHDNCMGDQIARSDVFYFYPVIGSTSIYGDSINQLKYSDVLYYNNWRKYGVEEGTSAETP